MSNPNANIFNRLPGVNKHIRYIGGIKIPKDRLVEFLLMDVNWYTEQEDRIDFVLYEDIHIQASDPIHIHSFVAPDYPMSSIIFPQGIRHNLRAYMDWEGYNTFSIDFIRCLFQRSQIMVCDYPMILDHYDDGWIILETDCENVERSVILERALTLVTDVNLQRDAKHDNVFNKIKLHNFYIGPIIIGSDHTMLPASARS